MKIVKLQSNPEWNLEGNSRHFGSVWEVELETGETTQPHQHPQLEEIYCCVEGEGEIVVAEKKHALARGAVFYVPRLTNHWLENNSPRTLRCLTVESHPLPDEEASAETATAAPGSMRETLSQLEQQIDAMPKAMNQAEAIQQIVWLFDTAGQLSEQIERSFGLDNEDGVNALTRVERRIMDAVVEITRRYQKGEIDLDGFGGRLRHLG